MGFLKSFFGGKKEIVDDPAFTADFYASLKRYLCLKKDEHIEFEFKDKRVLEHFESIDDFLVRNRMESLKEIEKRG